MLLRLPCEECSCRPQLHLEACRSFRQVDGLVVLRQAGPVVLAYPHLEDLVSHRLVLAVSLVECRRLDAGHRQQSNRNVGKSAKLLALSEIASGIACRPTIRLAIALIR